MRDPVRREAVQGDAASGRPLHERRLVEIAGQVGDQVQARGDPGRFEVGKLLPEGGQPELVPSSSTGSDLTSENDFGAWRRLGEIINSTYITLDGVVEGPHLWPSLDRPGDERGGPIQTDLLLSCDAVLMGRRTYEGFAPVWPTRSGDPYSDRINTMPKQRGLEHAEGLRTGPTRGSSTAMSRHRSAS